MPKRIVVFASSKGGVGKSYASRAFIDLARIAGRRVSAYDLDSGTGSLALLYPERDSEVGVGVENVRSLKAPGRWIESMYSDCDDLALDVPGGALMDLVRVLGGEAASLASEAKKAGRELVLVSVVGIKHDSTTSPQMALKLFSEAHHVVLKNGFFGDLEDFQVFDGIVNADNQKQYGKTGEAVIEAGAEVLYLPKLNSVTDAVLDLRKLTFAAGSEAIEAIGRRHTVNTQLWLEKAEKAFTGSWIDPTGAVPTGNGKAARTRTASTNG
jgi:hypothetical protein